MEPTTSESEQDGGLTSGEDNSFERPSVSSSETDSQFAEQNQVPYRTSASTANPDNYAGMMIPSSYLPFMMPQSYQSAVQGTSAMATTAMPYAAANAFFFNQNSLSKGAEGLPTTGSPLNLHMAGGQTDRPRIGSAHGDFNGATVQQQQQQHSLPPASPSPGIQHARASPRIVTGSPYASPAHQPAPSAYAGVAGNPNQLPVQGRFTGDTVYAKTDGAPKLTDYPPPPKKPLTPYMRFNKFMWETVKSSNPSMGVCEISATIGRLWRELGPEDKQRHNDEYTLDKARYDEELKVYLKTTGLRSSDLVKQKPKKSKPSPAQQRRPAAPPASVPPARPAAAVPADLHQQQPQQHAQLTANHHQQQQQQLQALMGLPGSLPIGMPVSFQNMSMLGGLPQMWATAAGQQYAGGLVTASQLQELYGGVNGVEVPPPAHNQQPSSASGDAQSSALYRYPQSFM